MNKNPKVAITKQELAIAFDKWNSEYKENPDNFSGLDAENYGEECANYIFELVEKQSIKDRQ